MREMIKNLRVDFTPEEKTVEKVEEFLRIVGDNNWNKKHIEDFIHTLNYGKIIYLSKIHRYGMGQANLSDGTEISFTKFLEKYDKPVAFMETMIGKKEADKLKDHQQKAMDEITQICDNPDVINAKKREMETDSEDHIPDVGKKVFACSGEFNGGYIEASQEAYDLLLVQGITVEDVYEEDGIAWYFWIQNSHAHYAELNSPTFLKFIQVDKQFYINKSKLSWEKPEDEELTYDEANPIYGMDATVITPESVSEQLEEKFKSDNYRFYYQNSIKSWDVAFNWNFIKEHTKVVPILKEHSRIADAIIENPDIVVYAIVNSERIEALIGGDIESGFFNTYNEEFDYKIDESSTLEEIDYLSKIESNTRGQIDKTLFEVKVREVVDSIAEMLIDKNAKYGNSALEPKRIFSKASTVEQLNVRIDDKLSRMANQSDDEDEDIELDLVGYLILKMIAKKGK